MLKLTITSCGGHGRSAKLKDLIAAFGGTLALTQAGISIVESSPGANAAIVYEIGSPSVDKAPQPSCA